MRQMTVLCFAALALIALAVGCSSSGDSSGSDDAWYELPSLSLWSDDEGDDGAEEDSWLPTFTSRETPDYSVPLIEPEPAAEIGYRLGWASPIDLLRGQRVESVTALGDIVIVVETR